MTDRVTPMAASFDTAARPAANKGAAAPTAGGHTTAWPATGAAVATAESPDPQTGHHFILGMRVDNTSYAEAARRVLAWAARGESRSVCCANVHMAMEAADDDTYRAAVNAADLVTPDGMPLVWALRALGATGATRVYGPDLMTTLLADAAAARAPIGFFGAEESTLTRLIAHARDAHPEIDIRYAYAPPFRPLTSAEDAAIVQAINASGARILFAGLGCPKQERWIAAHRGRVLAVMLGVGAAFDFLAGVKPKAPAVLQSAGLEWLFRLATEPRRLWRRYLYNNPRFVALLLRQLAAREQA